MYCSTAKRIARYIVSTLVYRLVVCCELNYHVNAFLYARRGALIPPKTHEVTQRYASKTSSNCEELAQAQYRGTTGSPLASASLPSLVNLFATSCEVAHRILSSVDPEEYGVRGDIKLRAAPIYQHPFRISCQTADSRQIREGHHPASEPAFQSYEPSPRDPP